MHFVPDNPMVLGMKAGRHGVVARKGFGREDRNEGLGPNTACGETVKVGGRRLVDVIPAKSIDRNEQDGWSVRFAKRFWDGEAQKETQPAEEWPQRWSVP